MRCHFNYRFFSIELFVIICCMLFVPVMIVVPIIFILYSKIKYVVYSDYLCIYFPNKQSHNYPMKELVILNEEKIYKNKPKISNIIIKTNSVDFDLRGGFFHSDSARKIRFFGIENPEKICDLLNDISEMSKNTLDYKEEDFQ